MLGFQKWVRPGSSNLCRAFYPESTKKLRDSTARPSTNIRPIRTALPDIKSRVHETFAYNHKMDTAPSRYLSSDIVAALKLGDTAYLNNELDWVKDLLTFTNVPVSILGEFLKSYE